MAESTVVFVSGTAVKVPLWILEKMKVIHIAVKDTRFMTNNNIVGIEPDVFKLMVDCLRFNNKPVDISGDDIEAMWKAAEMIQCKDLMIILKPGYHMEYLTDQDLSVRTEEHFQKTVVGDKPCWWTCVDLFVMSESHKELYRNSSSNNSSYPTIFEKGFNIGAKSVHEFQNNLDWCTVNIMKRFGPSSNVILAGGAVLKALGKSNSGFSTSDADFFVHSVTEETKLRQVIEKFADAVLQSFPNSGQDGIMVVRTDNALSFFFKENDKPIIQLITRAYPSAAAVLMSFDIDCCAVAYDGQTVRATPRALRALYTSTNVVDIALAGQTYERRLLKYAVRGFRVAIPGHLPNAVNVQRLTDPYISRHRGLSLLLAVFLGNLEEVRDGLFSFDGGIHVPNAKNLQRYGQINSIMYANGWKKHEDKLMYEFLTNNHPELFDKVKFKTQWNDLFVHNNSRAFEDTWNEDVYY